MTIQSYNCYNHISSWYDQIMCHVDYAEWSEYIVQLLEKHKVVPRTILELGAGTCQHGRFLDFGPESQTVYTDLSHSMLAHAWGKAQLRRVCCDMKLLPFKPGFDFVMMMYDAFNYLVSEYDVEDMFNEVHQILGDGGHFLFDITTTYNSETYFYDETFYEECDGIDYVRNSWYDEENQFQHNDFTFFVQNENGSFIKVKEDHIQKVYPYKTVIEHCKEAGFKVIAAYADNEFKKPSAKALRIHILVKKI